MILASQILFALVLLSNSVFVNQNSAEILIEVEQTVRQIESGWKYQETHCTCPYIAPGQISMAAAEWERRTIFLRKKQVTIVLHELPSDEVAEEALAQAGKWSLGQGWQREKYDIGDGGYLTRNRKEGRVELWFRTGHMVGEISGNSLIDAKKLVNLVVREVTAGQKGTLREIKARVLRKRA